MIKSPLSSFVLTKLFNVYLLKIKVMTIQELKNKIIEDETQFIIEMHTDVDSTIAEVSEAIENFTTEINSCQTPEELVGAFIGMGYSEREANSHLFSYLIKN